uniref:Geranylgeranyl transferase type-2 subunit beta n=2 Tax=Sexangularia sp. CB-2014 TaxID=1486929 RepID=A0A7S1YLD8_9EUKA
MSRIHLDDHLSYIKSIAKVHSDDGPSLRSLSAEHLRVSGLYWMNGAVSLINGDHITSIVDPDTLQEFITACQARDGGFGGNVGLPSHMLSTTSALQLVLALPSLSLSQRKVRSACSFIGSCVGYGLGVGLPSRPPDHQLAVGDAWGEVDTRFAYTVLLSTTVVRSLDRDLSAPVPNLIPFILSCRAFDGAFGREPGAESHAGQTFCAVAALCLSTHLGVTDRTVEELLGGREGVDRLAHWLVERQGEDGGLNGRPEKLPDVCYSFWVMSTLACIDRLHWLRRDDVVNWILSCASPDGGFADRPGNVADPYHTFFALAGLSLLGAGKELGLGEDIDPALALPVSVAERWGIQNESWSRFRKRWS